MQFSVLMSVYKNEKPEYFAQAVDSVLNQTLMPNEIILMRDGPVPKKLQKIIDGYLSGEYRDLFSYYPMKTNHGLGNALKLGVIKAKYDYIARMDTDDIAKSNRFELQVKYMEEHPEVSVCGGQIFEFIGNKNNVVSKREVPLEHSDIVRFMKKRNAFSHMTVMFKKQDVIDAGNYIEMYLAEDYYLWCRMMVRGYIFANLPEILVYARTGTDMYKRRGGYKYYLSLKKLEEFKQKNKLTNRIDYLSTLSMRFLIHVLLPNKIRAIAFKCLARK